MANTIKVRTDHKWRQFTYRYDVPAKVLASQFDYHRCTNECAPDECDCLPLDGFFEYLGTWYHTDQFMRLSGAGAGTSDPNDRLAAWDGYAGDSFFSGVVIKLASDGERFQVGRYCVVSEAA
jgi:hypothetical protein